MNTTSEKKPKDRVCDITGTTCELCPAVCCFYAVDSCENCFDSDDCPLRGEDEDDGDDY